MAGYAFSLVLRLGSNLVLARLLAPEMFGVMSIAYIVLAGLTLLSDLGLRINIVQSQRGADPSYLNTAWTIQILRGTVLFAVTLLLAFWMSLASRFGLFPEGSAYSNPVLPLVIAVLSFSTFISGFESTKLFEASRNLSLRRPIQIELASQLGGLLFMLCWAVYDRSIWVLVIGGLSSGSIRVALSHLWLPGSRNRWHWEKKAASEIIHFGKWIIPSSVLGFFAISGDRLLLGGLITATELGIYSISFNLFSALEQMITRIVVSVAFPAISEVVRERPHELKQTYYKILLVITTFAYFCSGALLISGGSLIKLLYDSRYASAGWMLEYLSIMLITAPFNVAVQCFLAKGHVRLNFLITATRFVGLVLLLPFGFHFFGLPGALLGLVSSRIVCIPLIVYHGARLNFLDVKRELALTPIILIGCGFGELVSTAVKYWIQS